MAERDALHQKKLEEWREESELQHRKEINKIQDILLTQLKEMQEKQLATQVTYYYTTLYMMCTLVSNVTVLRIYYYTTLYMTCSSCLTYIILLDLEYVYLDNATSAILISVCLY